VRIEKQDPLFTEDEREQLRKLPQELRAAEINLRALERSAEISARAAEHREKRAADQRAVVRKLRIKHGLCVICGQDRGARRTRCHDCLLEPDFCP